MNRYIIFSAFIALALAFSNCTSEPIVVNHELNGVYEGTAFAESSRIPSSILLPDWQISEEIRLEIVYPSFTKMQLAETEGCTGTVIMTNDQLDFDGDDCDCWCNCNPLVDCGGDVILGATKYEIKGDSLIMHVEVEQLGYTYRRRIALQKK